jgi:DNA (cytosine-5)-methyltransferase 1
MSKKLAEIRRTFNLIVESEGGEAALKRKAALQIDELWRKSRGVSGPIDVIDFFSGCGGMSAGFVAANALFPAFRLALSCDIDPVANETYERNLGLKPRDIDVAALAGDLEYAKRLINSARQKPTAPLVMIGCAPCQGFSSHRNAAGENDIRNSLFVSFARIAAAVQPDVVICENVPEIFTDRHWPYVQMAKAVLSEAGYTVKLCVHDLASFGVPQQRFRAVILAMKKSFALPEGVIAREQYRTVRSAIGDLPQLQAGARDSVDPMHYTVKHKSSTVDTIKLVPKNGGKLPIGAGPQCLWRAAAKRGRAIYEDVYGRLWWDKPAITITAHARNPASGRYVHPSQDRGLSVREAALLQSFPRQYSFHGSLDASFRQIGNAVPPAFSASLAIHILSQLLSTNRVQTDEGITAPVGLSFSRLIPAIKAGHRSISNEIAT